MLCLLPLFKSALGFPRKIIPYLLISVGAEKHNHAIFLEPSACQPDTKPASRQHVKAVIAALQQHGKYGFVRAAKFGTTNTISFLQFGRNQSF